MNIKSTAKDEFARLIRISIEKTFPDIAISEKDLARTISYSKGTDWDISSSIALRMAKQAKSQPSAIAESIAKSADNSVLIYNITQLNGYINAKINEKELSRLVIGAVLEQREKYGSSDIGAKKRVLVEFPSINPNKPLHVGHLRNPLLSDAVCNILSFCSYTVERIDYIDDLGLQMAEILWGTKNIPWDQKGRKYDQFLGEEYVEINRHLKNPGVEDSIKSLLKRMELHGSLEYAATREIASQCVRAQYETLFAYNIYHDAMIWESDIMHINLLDTAMELLKRRNIARLETEGKYKGCLVVLKKGIAEGDDSAKVLIRSTGAATYIAKDIAFHMWKIGLIQADFKFSKFIKQPNGKYVMSSADSGESIEFGNVDTAITVVGSAQNMQQAILRDVIREIDPNSVNKLYHLSYGEISLAEGKISGRAGTWLGGSKNYTADDLLREVKAKALDIVKSSNRAGMEISQDEIAGKVTLAAIKFDFLRVEPSRKLVFDWERALDFNSNSGPYCMYMYARASRILEKSGAGFTGSMPQLTADDYSKMTRGCEFELIKRISECRETVEKACAEYKPSMIAEYVLDISLLFSKFYQSTDVLKSGDSRNLRLYIVMAARQIIYNMLCLLGIQTVERM
jgi:arginyl-tRNA synthetase